MLGDARIQSIPVQNIMLRKQTLQLRLMEQVRCLVLPTSSEESGRGKPPTSRRGLTPASTRGRGRPLGSTRGRGINATARGTRRGSVQATMTSSGSQTAMGRAAREGRPPRQGVDGPQLWERYI